MSALEDVAFCKGCCDQTVHTLLAQGRLECQTCHEVRDAGPNQMWADPTTPPDCPLCGGRGWPEGRPDLDCYGCDGLGVARPGYLPLPIEETP